MVSRYGHPGVSWKRVRHSRVKAWIDEARARTDRW